MIPVDFDKKGNMILLAPVPPRVEKPKPFRPMLANLHKGEDISFPVLAQPKLDGIRCIARAAGLFSRDNTPIETQPHIAAALKPLFDTEPGLVLDGELYLHDETLHIIAPAARTGARRLEFHVFDIVSSDPSADRQGRLDAIIFGMDGVVRVPTVLCCGKEALDTHYRQCLAEGHEGQMIRDPAAPYLNKRCSALLKRKPREDAEAEIIKAEVREAGNIVMRLRAKDGVEFNAPAPLPVKERRRISRIANVLAGLEATFRFSGFLPSGAPRDPVVTFVHEFPRM